MSGIDYLKKFFAEEGFHFDEKETFIMFKYQGFTFGTIKSSSPSRYLSLMLPRIYEANSENRRLALEVCNKVNLSKYISKLTIESDNSVWINYEFLPNSATTNETIIDALDGLLRARGEFLEEIEKM